MNDDNNSSKNVHEQPKLSTPELLVATSPLVAIAPILWRLYAMRWFDPGEFPVFLVALAGISTGVLGGLFYLALRRNRWWLWLGLFSMILGYVELRILFAVAMSQMH